MNTIDHWKTIAKILDEKRRELWSVVFKDAVVPIESLLPVLVNVPGQQEVYAYMLDIDALNLDQLAGVVGLLADKFEVPAQEIWKDLAKGVPILADGVIVSSSDQGLLFSLMPDVDDVDVTSTREDVAMDEGEEDEL